MELAVIKTAEQRAEERAQKDSVRESASIWFGANNKKAEVKPTSSPASQQAPETQAPVPQLSSAATKSKAPTDAQPAARAAPMGGRGKKRASSPEFDADLATASSAPKTKVRKLEPAAAKKFDNAPSTAHASNTTIGPKASKTTTAPAPSPANKKRAAPADEKSDDDNDDDKPRQPKRRCGDSKPTYKLDDDSDEDSKPDTQAARWAPRAQTKGPATKRTGTSGKSTTTGTQRAGSDQHDQETVAVPDQEQGKTTPTPPPQAQDSGLNQAPAASSPVKDKTENASPPTIQSDSPVHEPVATSNATDNKTDSEPLPDTHPARSAMPVPQKATAGAATPSTHTTEEPAEPAAPDDVDCEAEFSKVFETKPSLPAKKMTSGNRKSSTESKSLNATKATAGSKKSSSKPAAKKPAKKTSKRASGGTRVSTPELTPDNGSRSSSNELPEEPEEQEDATKTVKTSRGEIRPTKSVACSASSTAYRKTVEARAKKPRYMTDKQHQSKLFKC